MKSVRINVTMPADVLDQIDRYAEREGFTRLRLSRPGGEEGNGGLIAAIDLAIKQKGPGKTGAFDISEPKSDQRE